MCNIVSKNQDLIDITKGKSIYIYGNGVYGRTLFFFLKEHYISDPLGFVVTLKRQEGSFANVITLDEYSIIENDNTALIIGVSDKYRNDIINTVRIKCIRHVFSLNNMYWDYIIAHTSFVGVTPLKNIAILMYHRVDDYKDDLWKLNVSRKAFEKQIAYISNHYDVLRLEEDWTQKVNQNKKYVIITFDDGYADNYLEALPILEKYRVPATFFIPTDLIGTNDMFWWDELEELLIKDEYLGVLKLDGTEFYVKNKGDRKNTCREVRNRLKNLQPDEIKEKMKEIRFCLHQEKRSIERLRCIRFEELKKLSESEYASIGGHTKSHLSMGNNMSYQIMMEEVCDSLIRLKDITGEEITTFAFPFGGEDDYCDLADEVLCENGIKKAVIVKAGNISVSDSGYRLPRHMMFDDDDIEIKLNRIWGIYG